jgi:hypothetical protein
LTLVPASMFLTTITTRTLCMQEHAMSRQYHLWILKLNKADITVPENLTA